MHGAASAGRVHAEPAHPYRSPYQRDRDRIVHSSAFRRLAHKTQVFIGAMGDYHRSRLTHTLEMASIARTVGRTLRLNEDLVEALALAHDIGHPPFGHTGEDVLNECVADCGGFNHNAQALRIVELLETRYPDFPGLNLSQEILAGQRSRSDKLRADAGGRLLEVQTVDAADSIAYNAHDADDAVELGMLSLDELNASSLWRTAAAKARERYGALDDQQFRRAAVHELIDLFVSDLIRTSSQRLAETSPASAAAAMNLEAALVASSAEMNQQKAELQRLLFERVYRHPLVLEQRAYACEALHEMFAAIIADRGRLPAKFSSIADKEGLPRAAADYLAGMTDRFALEEHDRLVRK
ncbi:MAG: dNTP triphosphohydrolase [Pirellulales bacterium]|nr:dNTP triphosphohydrolase [Pirellulales bacterium]